MYGIKNASRKLFESPHVVGLLFAVYLVVGLVASQDYGVSTDEDVNILNAQVSAKYAIGVLSPSRYAKMLAADSSFARIPSLTSYVDRDYGVGFDLPLFALRMVAGIRSDKRAVFGFNHAATFVFCWFGVWCLYGLVRDVTRRRRLGLLLAAVWATTPRFFAENCYNLKDAVFAAAFAVALWAAWRWFARPKSIVIAFVAGAAAGFATDIRPTGIILAASVLVWFSLVRVLRVRGVQQPLPSIVSGCMYVLGFGGVVYLCCPYLWASPFVHFAEALQGLSRFRLERMPDAFPFAGNFIHSNEVPPYYLPVWMAITLPPVYLLALLAAVWLLFWQFLTKRWVMLYESRHRFGLLCVGLAVAPMLAAAVLHSPLYNGWRHFYFVYPALLAAVGVVLSGGILAKFWQKVSVWVLVLGVLVNSVQVFWLHPYEYTYFNVLAGVHPERRFEGDYWSVSYRSALLRLSAVTADVPKGSPPLRLYFWGGSYYNLSYLAPSVRSRFTTVGDTSLADYILYKQPAHPLPRRSHLISIR